MHTIQNLKMAPVRVDPGRKPSGDTNTVMVRCHMEQHAALMAGGARHADQIKQWHDAYVQARTDTHTKKGDKNE